MQRTYSKLERLRMYNQADLASRYMGYEKLSITYKLNLITARFLAVENFDLQHSNLKVSK